MIDRRFQIDERTIDECCHGVKASIRQIGAEILALSKSTDAQHVAVRSQHWQAFANVFGSSAVHHLAIASLQLPGALTWSNHEGRAAESRHAGLERRQGAQRRIHKQQSEHLSTQGLWFGCAFKTRGESNQVLHLFAPQFGQIDEALHAGHTCYLPISSSAERSCSTCSACKMKGGSSRNTMGSPLVPARMSRSSSALWISMAGREQTSPASNPAP